MKVTDNESLEALQKAVEYAQKANYEPTVAVLFMTKKEWAEQIGTDWPGLADCQNGVRYRFIISNGEVECG
jgi:hypothetical protein